MKSFELLVLGLVLTTLERIERMEKALTDAIANLNSEVADESTKLGSIKTYVEGVPGIVASAVAQALANVGVEETAAAAEIEAARQQAADSVTDTLAAVSANTPATDQGGTGTGADQGSSSGSDTTGSGTTGSDTSGAGTSGSDTTGTGSDTSGGAPAGGDTSGTSGADAGTGADAGGGTGTGDLSGGAVSGDQPVE